MAARFTMMISIEHFAWSNSNELHKKAL
jgi:hypothetical protein